MFFQQRSDVAVSGESKHVFSYCLDTQRRWTKMKCMFDKILRHITSRYPMAKSEISVEFKYGIFIYHIWYSYTIYIYIFNMLWLCRWLRMLLFFFRWPHDSAQCLVILHQTISLRNSDWWVFCLRGEPRWSFVIWKTHFWHRTIDRFQLVNASNRL